MSRKGTISKDRVKKNGEVFTPDEIVNDMLDMLDNEIASKQGLADASEIDDYDYIKNTRLEPTCGDGAILVRILDRKLGRVQKIKEQGGDWREALLYSVASIYGVDITADNVVMSKRRMLDVIENGNTTVLTINDDTPIEWHSTGFELDTELKNLIQLILDYNIQCGNLLTAEQYKIYETAEDLWNCSIDFITESNVFRHKTDDKNKELEDWKTQTEQLMLTQWKFEGTQYINRQLSYDSYKTYMETGQTPMYYNTTPLSLYCKHINASDELTDDYDF